MKSVISHTSYARAAAPRGEPVARQSTRRVRPSSFSGFRNGSNGTITVITKAAVGPQPMRGADGPPGPQGPPGNSGDSGVSFPEAPTDGNAYLRANSDWSSSGTLTGSLVVSGLGPPDATTTYQYGAYLNGLIVTADDATDFDIRGSWPYFGMWRTEGANPIGMGTYDATKGSMWIWQLGDGTEDDSFHLSSTTGSALLIERMTRNATFGSTVSAPQYDLNGKKLADVSGGYNVLYSPDGTANLWFGSAPNSDIYYYGKSQYYVTDKASLLLNDDYLELQHWDGTNVLSLLKVTSSGSATVLVDPVDPLGIATKQYVDNAAPPGGPFLPLSGGTMTGSLSFIDAAVPNWEPWRITNTQEASTGNPGRLQITRDNAPVNVLFEGWDSGGGSAGIHVTNGTVTVDRNPSSPNEVATKNYVDAEVSSVWVQMTQVDYDAMPSPNPSTLYVIVG